MPTRMAYPARPRRGPLRSPLAAAPHSPLVAVRPGARPDRGRGVRRGPGPALGNPGRVRRIPAHPQQQRRPPVRRCDRQRLRLSRQGAGRADDRQRPRRGLHHRRHGPAQRVLPRVLPDTRPKRHPHPAAKPHPVIQLPAARIRPPQPVRGGLNRYAEVRGRPKTLSPNFVDDMLEVTGGGKARDFETASDHAIIRILRSEGIRRQELLGMVMHTLPADLLRNPVFRLVRPERRGRTAGEPRASHRPGRPFTYGRAALTSSPILNGCGSGPGTAGASGTPGCARCSSGAPPKPDTPR